MIDYYLGFASLSFGLAISFLLFKFIEKTERLFYLPLIYGALSRFSSVFYLSNSQTYILEAEEYSQLNNVWLFFLVCIIFFFSISIYLSRKNLLTFNFLHESKFSFERDFFRILLPLILFIYILNILLSGSPIPVNRHNFYLDYTIIPENFLIFGVLIICLIPLTFSVFSSKKVITLIVFIYFFYLFLSGQKLHGILMPFFLYLAIRNIKFSEKINYKKYIILLVIPITLVFLDFANRSITGNFDALYDAVLYRILVIQGGVYKYIVDSCSLLSCSELTALQSSFELRLSFLSDSLINDFDDFGINLATGIFHTPVTDIYSLGVLIIFPVIYSLNIKFLLFCYRKKLYLELLGSSYMLLSLLIIYERGVLFDSAWLFLISILFIIIAQFYRISIQWLFYRHS